MSKMRAPRYERVIGSAIFGYELAAIWSDLPTITWMARRHPWLAALIVLGLIVHFIPPDLLRAAARFFDAPQED